jgi:hypothetical protein
VVIPSEEDEDSEKDESDPINRLADLLQGRAKVKEREEKEFPFVLETFLPYFENQHTVFSLLTALTHALGVTKSAWRAKEFVLLEQWIREAEDLTRNEVDVFSMKEFCRRGRKCLWSMRCVIACEEEGRDYKDLMGRFELSTDGADFVSHKMRAKARKTGHVFPRGGNGPRGGFRGRGGFSAFPQRGEQRGKP